MDDVAAAAGVSRATVSRALSSDGQLVSSETMAAIKHAVRQTGYVLNQHARSLATHRSQTIGFIVCEPQQRLVEDTAFSILLSACAQLLAVHRLELSLMIAADPGQRARVCEHVASGQLAGVLVISPDRESGLVRELQASEVPMVVYGSAAHRHPLLAQVTVDDRSGARQIVRHLRERGRRTIATIAGPLDRRGGADRLAGWQDLLGPELSGPELSGPELSGPELSGPELSGPEPGLSGPELSGPAAFPTRPSGPLIPTGAVPPAGGTGRLVAFGDYTCASGRAAMASLLERVPGLDAVFVASDLMAAGAVTALRQAGRRVPDDVAVAGFGDSSVATSVEPALTTVRQPLSRAGTEMVRLLRDLIDGGAPSGVVLPTELVIRDST